MKRGRRRGRQAAVPWALRDLLRDGPAPLADRPQAAPDTLDAAIVLPPGSGDIAEAGLPQQLLEALAAARISARVVPHAEAPVAVGADVVLAAGWLAAPAVLRLGGVRTRAVLASADPPPLGHLGWDEGVPVLGPAWLGGTLPTAADSNYAPLPVHRRSDLVLVHGDDLLSLLGAAELLERRPGLTVAVSGTAAELELPFPAMRIQGAAAPLAHAFGSATVAFAPSIRGWRPAAVAMIACGQATIAPAADAQTTAALGDAITFVTSPAEAAAAAERLIDDLELRSQRVLAGLALTEGGWGRVAAAVVEQLRHRG